MRAHLVLVPLLVSGCSLAPTLEGGGAAALDLDATALAFGLARPDEALLLLDDLSLWLPLEPGCPTLDLDTAGVERWQGGCTLSDGGAIDGSLERLVSADGAWVAGNGLRVVDADGHTTLQLDGAVELLSDGALAGIGASYTACGLHEPCDGGLATVDLAFNLFPYDGFPLRYDLVVEGVVASAVLPPTAVSGTVSVDHESCGIEPASGSLLVHGDLLVGLDFDGASSCDACASLALEGLPMGPGCADWLP